MAFMGLAISSGRCTPAAGPRCDAATDSSPWLADVEKAAAIATQQGKDLLLLFSSSAENQNSEKLVQEILSQDGFETEISNDFVLVKLEFSTGPGPGEADAPHLGWAKRYGITTFPTLVLTDATMQPFAITGYQPGGLENYLGLLSEYRKARQDRDLYLAKAAQSKGAAKAKWLDKAISGLDPAIAEVYYVDIIEQIVELDGEDKLGLRSKWNAQEDAELRKIIMTDLMFVARIEQPEAAVKLIDQVLQEINFPVAQKLEILQIKLGVVKKLNDPQSLDALMEEMINLDGVAGDTKQRLIVKKIMLMVGSGRKAAAMELLDSSLQAGADRGNRNLFLWAAKGDLLMAEKKFEAALDAFERAIPLADRQPDVLIELVAGKSDAMFALERKIEALQTLDNFADDKQYPADLRAEATLQKSMRMREMGSSRLARLSENRAVEIADTPELKGEIQKVVLQLRRRFEQVNENMNP
jgi:tetratricopeptide (TPR) repeat protein